MKSVFTISLILLIMSHLPALAQDNTDECMETNFQGMVKKQPMQTDGIVRLSIIEVFPEYLDEYLDMAAEVGTISLQTEPGVLTMYALQQKENPCIISILETYASGDDYKSHIASPHFQKYKQGTLHMVKKLELLDQTPLNLSNKIINYIEPRQ